MRIVLGSIPTRLGKPVPGNGTLEVKGDDKVKVSATIVGVDDSGVPRAQKIGVSSYKTTA